MKVVILSSRFPFPIEKGDKLRLYHQMKGLAERHEVILISLAEEEISDKDLQHVQSFCKEVHLFPMSGLASKLLAGRALLNAKPFQVNYFFRQRIKSEIHELIEKVKPDVIYCQLIRMAEYVKEVKYPKVLDFMDAFSLGASRRSKYDHGLMSVFFKNEAKRLEKYEATIAEYFDGLTIISEQDKAHLLHNSIALKSKMKVVSNGIDVGFFSPSKTDKEFDVVFVGNMGYHPNVLAADFLIKKIRPLLNEDIRFQIAGTRPTSSVKSLQSKQVVITGWMKDIRSAYNNSRIFVAPIFSGAGQQNKILEAMAMGLPCITTTIVNEGVGAKPNEQILVADTKEDYAKAIELLIDNNEKREDLIREGRKFVEKHFSWQVENNNLAEYIKNTIKDK